MSDLMDKRTKTPWRVEHANGAHPAFVSIYADLGENGSKHVAAIGNGSPWADHLDEWLANARLIVTAVNEREALLKVEQALRAIYNHKTPLPDDVIDIARSALSLLDEARNGK